MADTLAELRRAARRKAEADVAFREALLKAYDKGHGYSDLARAAGMSRQGIRQRLLRASR